jgi:hypothetical protein
MNILRKLNSGHVFIALLAFLFLIVSIFSYSNYPSSDDFSLKLVFDELGFWGFQKHYYNNWTGRFFGVFLTSITNPIFYKSFFFYKLVPIITFIVHYLSLIILFKNVLSIESLRNLVTLASIVFIVVFASLSSIVDAFYWYPAAWYTSSLSINYFCVASLFRFYTSGKTKWYILSAFLTFASCGLLEISFILTIAVILAFILDDFLRNNKINYRLFFLLLIALVCIVVSITAPGNLNRSNVIAEIENSRKAVRNLSFTFLTSLKYFTIDYLFSILKGPLPWLLASLFFIDHEKLPGFKCKIHPVLFLLVLFGVVYLHYFVFYYAAGVDVSLMSRSENANFAFSVTGLFIITIYTIKWYDIKPIRVKKVKYILYTIVIFIFLFSSNMKSAYKNIRGRDFIAYHDEMEARIQLINKHSQDTIIVPALKYFPKWSYYSDITDKFSAEANLSYSHYWNLKAIKTYD